VRKRGHAVEADVQGGYIAYANQVVGCRVFGLSAAEGLTAAEGLAAIE
jgi:hypothetical protein